MSNLQNSLAPKVFLSPFVLSTVMLDNSNCPGDQEGFLIGKSYKSVRFEINDQSLCNTEEDLMISVFSAFPCGSFLSFYDCRGVINVDFIKNFLGDRLKSVIGWYRFRRNVPPYPSAREAVIHRNLMRAFSGNLSIGDNFFTYGVFGASASESSATHTYDYAFYVERPDRYIPLVMSMLNLIDTKTKYRSGSLASSFVNSQTFDSVLNIAWSFESCWQTEDGIQQMHKLLRDKCSGLSEELTASESVNATIEEDVVRLEAELESLNVDDEGSAASDDSCDENIDQENVDQENVDLENVGQENADQENADQKNADQENADQENADQKNADQENADQENADQENAENIPPPEESNNLNSSRKRYWNEVIDFENEKRHSVYGKFFEQYKATDSELKLQESSEASDSSYYVLPPPKKFKVLQEHKRVIDHDYSSASDDDSHKYAHDIDDKVDDIDGVSLNSETEDCASIDGTASVSGENVTITNEGDVNDTGNIPDKNEESVKIENENKNTNSSGFESPVESSSSGRPHIIYCKPADKEEEPGVSHKED